ncbi:MAG: tripartite tricarboxylate transporter substrate binding protein [Betaproteobacteria bacterium]|nr:tripartite tricarboxylate transporter substrate binding protein [Betaproteobacteria bacterium]
MRSISRLTALAFITLCNIPAGAPLAQDYPSKPIRIVTGTPGSGADVTARLIAQGISGGLGQQVIVENRGGGSGIVAGETVANAAPNGYTLLLFSSPIWLLHFMQDNVPYDPVTAFSPITLAVSSPNILVVHPSLPVRSVRDLIALAKARPGELNYASGGTGSPSHLSTELFKSMADVNMVRIPYTGTGPALNAVIGGEAQLMFPTAPSGMPHVRSGRLRALAVTSARSSALAAGLPTVAASGMPGYESEAVFGMFAPAKTPAAIVNRLNQEIVRALNNPNLKERFFNAGTEVVGSSPEAFTAFLKSDMAKMGKVIKNAGIRAN